MTASRAGGAWFVRPRPEPAPWLRLICLPGAGGGASAFRPWLDRLPAGLELWCVQLPGRESRIGEPALDRIEPLVQSLADALLREPIARFVLFGHSMGALVAFELARHLRRSCDLLPVHLFVSARRAPQLPAIDAPIHFLPDAAFTAEVRRLNGTPEAILEDAELWPLLMPALRADFAVCDTYGYVHEQPLDCPVTAFGGWADARVPRSDLVAWRAQTSSRFEVRMFAGDHFFVRDAGAEVVKALVHDLAAAQPAGQSVPESSR